MAEKVTFADNSLGEVSTGTEDVLGAQRFKLFLFGQVATICFR